MRVLFAVLAPVVLLAGGAAAADEDADLKNALVKAGRKSLSVAPWVKLTVDAFKVDDKLTWTMKSDTGQLYACSAPADADALLTGKVDCKRAALSPQELAAREARDNARVTAGRANKMASDQMSRDRSSTVDASAELTRLKAEALRQQGPGR